MARSSNKVAEMSLMLRMEDHCQRSQDPPKISMKWGTSGLEKAEEGGFQLGAG